MVKIVMKNHTRSLRVMSDAHGAGAHNKIAVGGNAETEPLTLSQLRTCAADVKVNLQRKYVSLIAKLGEQAREVSFDEAIALLKPAPTPTFNAPPGKEVV